MHKLIHRVHSNSKDNTCDKKKKKGAKSNVKSAIKTTMVASLTLPQAETAFNQPNGRSDATDQRDQDGDCNEVIYSMASNETSPSSRVDEIEEGVYEITDFVVIESLKPAENATTGLSCDDDHSNTAGESVYDMADSLTRDCFVGRTSFAKTESYGNESDTDPDDTYSHLVAESPPTDQVPVYDKLERNLSNASDAVYDSLGEHDAPSSKDATRPIFQSSCYEDIDFPSNNTNMVADKCTATSEKSNFSEGDDAYEDVSITFPIITPASSNHQENDERDENVDDDTYEDVSKLPIQRFREQQPLPEMPKRNLNGKPLSINNESVPINVSPSRRVSESPDITLTAPGIDQKPVNTNEGKLLLKHSKTKHPSQWFSKPFLKTKTKFDLRKRSNSKLNMGTLNSNESAPPVSTIEKRDGDINQSGRERMPTPQGQDRLTSPNRVTLAVSLEENRLYKSMQNKLNAPGHG